MSFVLKGDKMNKSKRKNGKVLLEVIAEIILMLVFFGIGALILRFFGVRIDSEYLDGDLIILIGILVPVLIFAAVSALVKRFKKIFSNKRK